MPLRSQLRAVGEGINGRRVWNSRQQSALIIGHLRGLLSEISLRRIINAVIAAAKIDGVQIQLQNLILGIIPLQIKGHKQLRHLTEKFLFLGKIHVLGKLLGNGASALRKFSFPQVDDDRPACGNQVQAAVFIKTAVLHCDHRILIGLRQLVQRGIMGIGPDFRHFFGKGLFSRHLFIYLISLPDQPAAHHGGAGKQNQQGKKDQFL